ncbi:MAG: tetratricopeptide repeat protein [Planctomycetes bacterium]|nr:tetratricopeptide repeat protein [Planctomycetota bacterium]
MALLLAAVGCSTLLDARPPTLAPAAVEPMARAHEARTRAAALSDQERRAMLETALAAARAAAVAAPEEFRAELLVQDIELELDPRGARERYANGPAEGAASKVLVARALLPDRSVEARALLESALKQDGGFAWALYGLAFVERRDGHSDRARELCEQALHRDPSLIEALRLLADLYEGGDRERAIQARQLLVEVTGGELTERHAFAQLLLEADDRSDASVAVRELRAILDALGDATTPAARELARDCWLDLGTAFARRANDEQAIIAWQRALALDRECLTALYNVGVAEQRRGDLARSLAAFEEYLARAQSMERSLPVDQVLYRHFYVPNQVRTLRERLAESPGDAAGAATEVAPTEVAPTEDAAAGAAGDGA